MIQRIVGVAAALAFACLLLWMQQQRIAVAQGKADFSALRAIQAETEAARQAAAVAAVIQTLQNERAAQAQWHIQHERLRKTLAEREQQIEGLKREDHTFSIWADQPLPGAARRLRERPALTGADAYHQWLSQSSAVPTTGQPADDQRRTVD